MARDDRRRRHTDRARRGHPACPAKDEGQAGPQHRAGLTRRLPSRTAEVARPQPVPVLHGHAGRLPLRPLLSSAASRRTSPTSRRWSPAARYSRRSCSSCSRRSRPALPVPGRRTARAARRRRDARGITRLVDPHPCRTDAYLRAGRLVASVWRPLVCRVRRGASPAAAEAPVDTGPARLEASRKRSQ